MKPIVQALLVADHVYTDQGTNKKVVAGIFHRLWIGKATQTNRQEAGPLSGTLAVPTGGFRAGSPFCYMSLTEVHGTQPFELRYVDLHDDKILFATKFEIGCNNPLQTIELVLPLPPLPVEKEGTFALELLWNNEHLGAHRINIEGDPNAQANPG